METTMEQQFDREAIKAMIAAAFNAGFIAGTGQSSVDMVFADPVMKLMVAEALIDMDARLRAAQLGVS